MFNIFPRVLHSSLTYNSEYLNVFNKKANPTVCWM